MKSLLLLGVLAIFALVNDQARTPRLGVPPGGGEEGGGELDSLPLLTTANIVGTIDGGFLLPNTSSNGQSFEGGLQNIAYDEATGTLYAISYSQYATELSIPEVVNTSNASLMNRATYIQGQGFADPLEGQNDECDGGAGDGCGIRGIVISGSTMCGVLAWFYDANNDQTKTHFCRPKNLSTTGSVLGIDAFFNGAGLDYTNTANHYAGFINQWIGNVPTQWQAALGGGDMYSGAAHMPIIAAKSNGPSAGTFSSSDVGSGGSQPYVWKALQAYPATHKTLGRWDPLDGAIGVGTPDTPYFSMGFQTHGCVMIKNSRTYACFQRRAETTCYGTFTADPELEGDPDGAGGTLCYDPEDASHGTHGDPYHYQVVLFDLLDMKRVVDGAANVWDELPYAASDFTFPITVANPGNHLFQGVAYDSVNQKIYLAQREGDKTDVNSPRPVVWRLSIGGL